MQISRSTLVLFLALVAAAGSAQTFTGAYSGKTDDGNCVITLKQAGDKVTGTYAVDSTKLNIKASVKNGKAVGFVDMEGTTLFYIELTLQGGKLLASVSELNDEGKADLSTTQKYEFKKDGGPAEANSAPAGELLTDDGLKSVAGKVKTNFKRQKGSTVLSPGEPPLTLESVAAFAGLMKLCFDAEMTESEFEVTSQHFIKYYEAGDSATKKMLATGWQGILKQIESSPPAQRAKSIKEVHDVMVSRFTAGAQTGSPWAVAMKKAIDARENTVATVTGETPAYAKKSELDTEMSEADLQASLEMLYFMWVASGRDPNMVTAEAAMGVRNAILTNFQTLPQEVQYILANGQKVYAFMRGQWAQATPQQRASLAQGYGQALDSLGLSVPRADDTIHAGGAWADMNGKSHSQWAGEMAVGLAGASYHNAWTSP